MNWDDLRYLLAVQREKTLSGAARRLTVNHSTVSRRLQAVEDELGTRVFDRRPDGYAPTEAGQDILRVAEDIEQQIFSLDRQVFGRDARLSGPLCVTTTDLVADRYAATFAEFAREYPEIDLEISVDNAPQSLSKREADVAIRLSNHPKQQLVGRRVARVEWALYAAQSLLDASPGASLDQLPWVAWVERAGARLTEQWMRENVPEATITARVDSTVAMFACVRDGMGISFLPCGFADDLPQLRRLRDPEPSFGMDLWLLTHPDLRTTARVRRFMEHMATALSHDAPALAGRPQPA